MNPIVGTLEFAKVLIAIFVMCYAYFFLRRSDSFDQKKPWEYLYVATMFLFLVELISALQLFRAGAYQEKFFNDLQALVEFGFLGFLLFSFISQHYLLVKQKKIVIEEKPLKTWWDRLKKKFRKDEEEKEPEEELKEEFSGMEEDDELKKEEKEIEDMLEEAENRTTQEEDVVTTAEKLIEQAEKLMKREGDNIDAKKAEKLKKDLEELKDMLGADERDLGRIAQKMQEIEGGDNA